MRILSPIIARLVKRRACCHNCDFCDILSRSIIFGSSLSGIAPARHVIIFFAVAAADITRIAPMIIRNNVGGFHERIIC